MPAVYEDLAAAGLLSKRRADRMIRINTVRNRLTHAYGSVTPEDVHRVIEEYMREHHADLFRAADHWFAQRGYTLVSPSA